MTGLLLVGLALAGPTVSDALDADGLDTREAAGARGARDDGVPAPGTPSTSARIIGGGPAAEEDFPSSGALLARFNLRTDTEILPVTNPGCSSVLIAPDVVLTAAHCIEESLIFEQFVAGVEVRRLRYEWTPRPDLGLYGLGGRVTPPRGSVEVAERVSHPDYVGAWSLQGGTAENHDIALLFLKKPILDIPHADLPVPGEPSTVEEGTAVHIVGWGLQENVDVSQAVPGVNSAVKHQARSLIGAVGPTEFQVGGEPPLPGKCKGDSGGPTYLEQDGTDPSTWPVIGITSHTWDDRLCTVGGVDTRVDAYLAWIDDEMRAGCEDGVRAWCEEPGLLPPGYVPSDFGAGCGCNGSAPARALLPAAGFALLVLGRRRRRSAR